MRLWYDFSAISCDITRGHTNSCGCYHKDQARKSLSNLRSQHPYHHKTKTKAYRCWNAMMQRCYNPKTAFYSYYGGRGITVCDRWHNYFNFLEDMGHPNKVETLDRVDSNGNYCPENCRWATMKKQNNNRRSCCFIYYQGIKYSFTQFCLEHQIPYVVGMKLYKNGKTSNELIEMFNSKHMKNK